MSSSRELITYVGDRPGHDRRYAIDVGKSEAELGWTPQVSVQEGLRRTVSSTSPTRAGGSPYLSEERTDSDHSPGDSRAGVEISVKQPAWRVMRVAYQLVQAQRKLVRCARGQVFDVAVDVRLGSPTFGQSVGVLLDDVTHHQLWVPPGFAHCFLVLSEVAYFCYLCSEYYYPQSEQGIAWNGPALGIHWPALAENTAIQLSAKEQVNPLLKDQTHVRLCRNFFTKNSSAQASHISSRRKSCLAIGV